jgi:hypothetical protein
VTVTASTAQVATASGRVDRNRVTVLPRNPYFSLLHDSDCLLSAVDDVVLDALCLATEPELVLLGRQFARAVPLELDPQTSPVDPDPEIRRARGRLRASASAVPAERDFATFGILQQQPARESALFIFLGNAALAQRLTVKFSNRRVSRLRDRLSVPRLVLSAHQRKQVRTQCETNPHRYLSRGLATMYT